VGNHKPREENLAKIDKRMLAEVNRKQPTAITPMQRLVEVHAKTESVEQNAEARAMNSPR
jgi:hypothetical protein